MDVRDVVMKENSRRNWLAAAEFVGNDTKRVAALMKLFLAGSEREVQVSSQVVSEVSDAHPEVILPYLPRMIEGLKTSASDAYKRITIRFCQFVDVPEDSEGALFEQGISFLKAAEESIAVKAFAMTALRRICEKYPELAAELIPQIEILVEQKASTAIVNRGEKELKQLRKLVSI